jgi:uncharacterized MAPEG superfamily protein
MFAGVMPIIWAGLAKMFTGFKLTDNAHPRQTLAAATGKAQRANWAQANSWEAFAPFAAAVIIAHQAGVIPRQIDNLALIFIVSRLLYGAFYIINRPTLRTLVWTSALIANLAMYWLIYRR